MQSYLVKFGILGVQDFIAEAARLRDIAAGSAAVTFLMGNLLEDQAITPILPGRPGAGARPVVSNVATLRVEAVSDVGLRAIMGGLRDKLKETCRGRVSGEGLAEILDLVWTAVPATEDYKQGFENLQRLFDQRKLTRTFSPSAGMDAKERCTVCAKRPAVEAQDARLSVPMLGAHERLCTLCRARRHKFSGKLGDLLEEKYPSTAHLAAWRPLEDRRQDIAKLAGDADAIVHEVEDYLLGFDVAQALEERLTGNVVAAELKRTIAKEASGYYAVIFADGDEMGKWLGGGKGIPEKSNLETFQRDLVKSMRDFDTALRAAATEVSAQVVYAGGDDALIFAPLENAITFVKKLKAAFEKTIGALGPTVSMSLTVAHAGFPLREVLSAGRTGLESLAKTAGGRDALAIQVVKSTGALEGCVYPWKVGDEALLETCDDFASTLTAGENEPGLSKAFVYDLLENLDAFYREDSALRSKEMLETEMRRLWRRHASALPVNAKTISQLGGLAAGKHRRKEGLPSLTNFRGFLRASVFFARKREGGGE